MQTQVIGQGELRRVRVTSCIVYIDMIVVFSEIMNSKMVIR